MSVVVDFDPVLAVLREQEGDPQAFEHLAALQRDLRLRRRELQRDRLQGSEDLEVDAGVAPALAERAELRLSLIHI